jgi:ribosomal protein S15P/S13E
MPKKIQKSDTSTVSSSSKKTGKKVKSEKISQVEFEEKVIELAKKGLTSEKIGEELRQQKIHPREYNKKISKILGDRYINPDLKNVEEKLKRIDKHCAKNKQDKRAIREKNRVFAQLRKLKKYFKI